MWATRDPSDLRRSAALLCLVAGIVTPAWSSPSRTPILGDANGDGSFDARDIREVLRLVTTTSRAPDPDMANVALPCTERVDMEDMRRLRAALAGRPKGIEMESKCHDGLIGQPYVEPPRGPAPGEATLDEQFALLAAEVPEFAGVHLTDEKLHIALTNTDPRIVEAARRAVTERLGGDRFEGKPVVPVKARYSYSRLDGWRTPARRLLALDAVYSIDLDEVENQVVIGLRSAGDQAAVEKEFVELVREPIPEDALTYRVVPRAIDGTFIDDLRARERPLAGGLQTAAGGSCTLGIVAKHWSGIGFVTASHCTADFGQVDGTVFHQPGNPHTVGSETWDAPAPDCLLAPGLVCTYADAAFVRLDPGVTAHRGHVMQDHAIAGVHVGEVVSMTYFPLAGEVVHKVGRTTGQTFGVIDATCVDMEAVSPQGVIYGHKLCQDSVALAHSAGGDSGSPVFAWHPAGSSFLSFYGIAHSSPDDGAAGFAFSPLGNIHNWFSGLDPLDANEPPTVEITSPAHATDVGTGVMPQVTLQASFWDLEDGDGCPQCEVTWSWPDGSQTVPVANGQTTPIVVDLNITGGQSAWIHAEARDSELGTSFAGVAVVGQNAAPNVTIVKPVPGEQVMAGWPYLLEGTSFDQELFGPLPCDGLSWTSLGIEGGSATGCKPTVTFPDTGAYIVKLVGTDPGLKTGGATRLVAVVAQPAAGPPLANILHPPPDTTWNPNVPVQLVAEGVDPDGKSPITYEWTLVEPRGDQQVIATTQAASGAVTPAQSWIPQTGTAKGLVPRTIRLEATDADNEVTTVTVEVWVYGPPS